MVDNTGRWAHVRSKLRHQTGGSAIIPKLIGLTGHIGSGKDQVAEALKHGLGFEHVKLADPLKRAVVNIFGVPPCTVYGTQEEKARPLAWLIGANGDKLSGRRLLQLFGTEGCRSIVPDVWINRLAKTIDDNNEAGIERHVVSDVRFRNEVEAIRKWGGVVWRVVCVGGPDHGDADHDSEYEWQQCPVDAILVARFGDLDELRRQAVETAKAGGKRPEA